MKPYSYGDEFDRDWEHYSLCPQCGSEWEAQCKCRMSHRVCYRGHRWCIEDGKVVKGDMLCEYGSPSETVSPFGMAA